MLLILKKKKEKVEYRTLTRTTIKENVIVPYSAGMHTICTHITLHALLYRNVCTHEMKLFANKATCATGSVQLKAKTKLCQFYLISVFTLCHKTATLIIIKKINA